MRRRGQRRVWRGVLRWVRRGVAAAWTLVLLAVAGVAAASVAVVSASGAAAWCRGSVRMSRITMDADGIPRILAGSARDGAAALGYLHARDRMFQMELMRRNASGRLSEVAGALALPQDRLMRTLGLRRRAEADLAGLDPETRGMLDAYARGGERLDRRARAACGAGVHRARAAGAVDGGGQPAVGQDDGAVPVGQLAAGGGARGVAGTAAGVAGAGGTGRRRRTARARRRALGWEC